MTNVVLIGQEQDGIRAQDLAVLLLLSLLVAAAAETQGRAVLRSSLLLADLTAGPEGAGWWLVTACLVRPVTAVVVTVTDESAGDALAVPAPEGLAGLRTGARESTGLGSLV